MKKISLSRAIATMACVGCLFAASSVLAAGMTTHGEAAIRASQWFDSTPYPDYRDWILADPGAMQAGAAFPDWGYAFGNGDAAEAAHWPPFWQAAAGYIRSQYPKPWSQDTQRLAVFLLGLQSHGIADIDWHGLGVDEGFLNVMAAQEFQGSFSAAHDHGDPGGDVMAAYELELGWMASPWYVPSVDMAEIYHGQGFATVTASDLSLYTGLMMAAQRFEKLAGASQFPTFAGPSPFLASEYTDYFVGGVDDIANQSAFGWEEMIDWMENGVSGAALGLSGPLAGLGEQTRLDHSFLTSPSSSSSSIRVGELAGGNVAATLAAVGISMEKTARGVVLTPNALPVRAAEPTPASPVSPVGEDRSVTYTTTEAYGYLGTSLAKGDFNHDGLDDLAIGSPGYNEVGAPQLGRVRIVSGRPTITGHEQVDLTAAGADVTLTGTEAYGRFGWAVAVADLNADGLDDLAVSAPTTGARGYQYLGKVFAYFGRAGGGLPAEPDVAITTDATYSNLGWTLGAGDLNGDGKRDLVIGAPFARSGGRQRGLVAVFFSSPSLASGTQKGVSQADRLLAGTADYGWFGYDVTVADVPGKGPRLLVGAPKFNNGAVQGVGRLYGFDPAAGSSPVFTITGVGELDNTGTALAYGSPLGTGAKLLALASPTASPGGATQAGSLALVSIDDLAGDVGLDTLPAVATINGTQAFARFGWRVGFADVNGDGADDLWATEPWRKNGAATEAGSTYLWSGGSSFPLGTVIATAQTALWGLQDTVKTSLFGAAIVFPDFDGDGSVDVAIGARHASTAGPEAGNLRLVLAPKPSPVSVSPTQFGVGTRRTVTISGTRFHQAGLSVRLVRGATEIAPTAVVSITSTSIRLTVDVPAGAELGSYDLVVADAFGKGTLLAAVEITQNPGPGCGSVRAAGSPAAACVTYLLPLAFVRLWRGRGSRRVR